MSKIIIIGAGTVGQATGKGLKKKGQDVIFVDNSSRIINELRSNNFRAYRPNRLRCSFADVCMISVPTPYKMNESGSGAVDLSFLRSALMEHAKWLKQRLNKYQYHVIVIRSTVPPGTTRNFVIPILEKHSSLKIGQQVGLCMQPEFLRAKKSDKDFLNPRAIIIGEYDKESGDILEKIYKSFTNKIFRVSLENAEFTKYIHNCFNATKISFANEMWLFGMRIGIDANVAIKLASKTAEGFWNPRYGIRGGKPYSGLCLPKDIQGFLAFAKEIAPNKNILPLISCVDTINTTMKKISINKEKRKYNIKPQKQNERCI